MPARGSPAPAVPFPDRRPETREANRDRRVPTFSTSSRVRIIRTGTQKPRVGRIAADGAGLRFEG